MNEKYGTSIEGWSQLPTTYEVGDTVPNWNAYEKIRMTSFYAKTNVNERIYIAKVENGVVNAIGEKIENDWYCTNVDENGVCVDPVFGRGIIEGLWVPKLQNLGVQVSAGTFIDLGYRLGDTIPNFSEYISIT